MKKISQIETGGRFLYGGVEWVKLYAGDGTVAISAEPVFERAFDEDNKNDWRSSSLRRELNGAFLDALVAEGADRAAFLDWESDLTADDGMTDYGTATDKIALLSDKLYRMFRGIIPRVDAWCWNLTPWTCDASNSYDVRSVYSSGAMDWGSAYYGSIGVRPLCYLKSEILVSVPGEDDEEKNVEVAEEDRAQLVLIASDRILNALNEYPVEVWGEALGAAVASLFTSKQDAAQIAQEDKSYPIEVKRRTIRDSIQVHRRLGTKYAVEKALGAVYPGTKVEEWFEYGGDPYKFRVVIGATEAGITADRQAAVLDRVRFYKNLRSHLEAISYQIEKRTAVKVAAVHAIGQRVEVYPYLARNMESHGGFYCGGYTQYGRKLAVFPNK